MATTIYDVLRYLVRNQGHANTGIERDLLLTVDAAERGYPDRESYEEVLAQQAREEAAKNREAANAESAAATPSGPASLTDEQLQAELDKRQALRTAQGGPQRQTLLGSPKPTS